MIAQRLDFDSSSVVLSHERVLFSNGILLLPTLSPCSQGFFLLNITAGESWPDNRVSGTSLIPGTGCPLVMSSTMRLKEVGYRASIATFSADVLGTLASLPEPFCSELSSF